MNRLTGKTALVSGASRGIGRASALALAKAGAQVLVHYGRGAQEAEAVVAEIRQAGGTAEKVAADLREADSPHLLARQTRAIVGGRLDILVANAGIAGAATIEETTVEHFDSLFAVNVRAPFFLVQQLLPMMCQGSSIVLLSSLVARAALGDLAAYAATKGAIDTLVKHFSAALGERGIRVNAVAPAWCRPTCPVSRRPRPGETSRSASRRSSAWRNRTTSARQWPSSPPTRRAGSPATPCMWTAARNSEHGRSSQSRMEKQS